MAFERVASLAEIPARGGLRVCAGGREIGLYRVGAEILALEDTCPHAGFPLHAGRLDGATVICPGHGWEFDLRTGLGPGEVEEPPLLRFPVRVEGDQVWLDPQNPLP